jgi:uncharacterized PurR-regulated membrane protein YhhQ (DUF165 family)
MDARYVLGALTVIAVATIGGVVSLSIWDKSGNAAATIAILLAFVSPIIAALLAAISIRRNGKREQQDKTVEMLARIEAELQAKSRRRGGSLP